MHIKVPIGILCVDIDVYIIIPLSGPVQRRGILISSLQQYERHIILCESDSIMDHLSDSGNGLFFLQRTVCRYMLIGRVFAMCVC